MKKLIYALLLSTFVVCSCDKEMTYAEQRENERKQIAAFIKKGCTITDETTGDILLHVAPITHHISEEEYRNIISKNPDYEMPENEYIYLEDLSVYMQIVTRGTGDMGEMKDVELEDHTIAKEIVRGDTLAVGQTRSIDVRYIEFNIAADSIQSSNRLSPTLEQTADRIIVSNNSGTITGTFAYGLMPTLYNSTSVPNAWLYPLYYIRLGRNIYADSKIAKVRLIVPSSEGQQDAYNNIYPCFYEITYMAAERR